PLVNVGLHGAVALVQRAGPVVRRRPLQSVERNIAKAPALDLHPAHAFARVVRGRRPKVARTPRRATAILDVFTSHRPFRRHFRHRFLLSEKYRVPSAEYPVPRWATRYWVLGTKYSSHISPARAPPHTP